MVIKLRSIINKCISISVCILLGFSVYKKCNQVSDAQKIVVETDSLLAEQTSSMLSHFIQASTYSLASFQFSQSLLQQFPCIDSFEVEKNPSGIIACTIATSAPVLNINSQWVLTENGHLARATDFIPSLICDLHSITMPVCAITDAFRACMADLPGYIYESYTIVWLNDQEVLLYDRAQPLFAIRFDSSMKLDKTILHSCNSIKNDMDQRGLFVQGRGKKPMPCIADVRFKNQIVISWGMGGSYG